MLIVKNEQSYLNSLPIIKKGLQPNLNLSYKDQTVDLIAQGKIFNKLNKIS